jgi:hypothetical protein
MKEELEDTKWVIRIRKSKKDRQRNGQKDIQRSTKHAHKSKSFNFSPPSLNVLYYLSLCDQKLNQDSPVDKKHIRFDRKANWSFFHRRNHVNV